MSISGKQTINIGLPNESTGSDPIRTAFIKSQINFDNLFDNASPYNTFTAGTGTGVTANANTGTVTITNTGVTSIVAGTNIVVNQANGAVTISATPGGSGSGTVTRVGLVPADTSRLTVTGGPNIVSSGTFTVDLSSSGAVAGTYTNPNVTVDTYGRITTIANGTIAGTVTSVGLTPGTGVQISGGPITSSGSITVTNTGVVRVNAGQGIALSSGNGNVTISATSTGGTVTSVGITSSQLTVSGSPIVGSGFITVDLPTSATFANTVTSANSVVSGRLLLSGSEDLAASAAANLLVTASHFTTTTAETATLAAGTEGQIKTFMMKGDGGDMVITVTNAGWKSSGTGTITFNTIGQACTLQYISSKWFCIGNNGATFA
jgi:fibronectin-binding autotransporter adhesin